MTQQSSIHTLYSSHNNWLRGWLKRRLGCSETAADLAHDTFVRLLSKPRQIDNLTCARSYLKVIAGRLCVDRWRRKSIEQAWLDVLAAQPEALAPSLEDHAIIVETFCELDDMLQRLPEKVATVFMRSQIEGLTYKQIASQMGVSERTIKSYMAKAMLECVLIEARWHESMRE